MAKKKIKIPEGACPFCMKVHPPNWFIAPETPDPPNIPNIIIIGEAPGHDELRAGSPFIGKSGRLLRHILTKYGAIPIVLNSRQCWGEEKPTTEQVANNRERFLFPILEKYPNIPIVALGAYAATYVVGGKHGETSMAGKSLFLYNRICSFTYHPAYYLYTADDNVLEEIDSTIRAALATVDRPRIIKGRLPKDVSRIVIDTETSALGYPWYNSELILVGILPVGFVPYILGKEALSPKVVERLNRDTRLVVGHNLMYDLVHLAVYGITFPMAQFHDTMIYHKNLFPNELRYGLKNLAKKYHGFPHWDAWFSRQLSEGADLKKIDKTLFREYLAYDLYATEALFNSQTKVYQPFLLEMDYLKYIRDMTVNGMFVDKKKLAELSEKYSRELAEATVNLKAERHLGEDFNFRSPAQVLSLLRKEIKGIADTKEATLLDYRGNPVVDGLLTIRNLGKLVGTGLDGLAPWCDSHDCVHSTVSVHGAETGRSSSSNPNVQNTDPRVRQVFVSRYKEGKLIYTDLSSLEYRIMAHMAREYKLITAFKNGLDIHRLAHEYIFGRLPNDEAERHKAKTCNYLAAYGGGYGKYLSTAEIEDTPDAHATYNRILSLYPSITRWKADTVRLFREKSYVVNLFGRKRLFNHIGMDEEREAINWIIQSTGHDILKLYLMEAVDRVAERRLQSLLINETHDSFTLDSPAVEVSQTFQAVTEVAENLTALLDEVFGVQMRLPITAKVKIISEWE